MTITQTSCDQCGKVKAEQERGWIEIKASAGSNFSFRKTFAHSEPYTQLDFCALRCLSEWATNAPKVEIDPSPTQKSEMEHL